MFTPLLRIPQQLVISDDYQGISPDEISVQNWLNQRDRNNLQDFLNTLVQLNRIQCTPVVRMSIMNILDVDIQNELEILLAKTNLMTFPINDEYQLLINRLQQLLLETSVAYQIIIQDIASNKIYLNQYLGSLIPQALFMAHFYLSRLLVERFQFYLSEPDYIWQELNQLYLLAERIGVQDEMISMHTSLKNCYLQVVLLKLLTPYRLMRFEARKIYHLMRDWVAYCEISHIAQHTPENHFVVDLAKDKSPHFFDLKKDKQYFDKSNKEHFELRIIAMEKLNEFLNTPDSKKDNTNQLVQFAYQARMKKEMREHIEHELEMLDKRSEERELRANEIKLVSGLSACHHFISDKKPFIPEDEINALGKLSHKNFQTDKLSIKQLGLYNEAHLFDKNNPLGELQSVSPFYVESDDELLTGEQFILSTANYSHHHSKEESWQQKNESNHGMLLVSKNDISMPIGVGMLVAYRLEVEKAYCLACVKWLRINPHKGIAIGMQLIAVQSRAIAVNKASQAYQRAFLISENDTRGKGGKQHLLVPTGFCESGETLNVWHNEKLNSVTLTRLLLATDSFERFAFKL
jgi:hypothetical protein